MLVRACLLAVVAMFLASCTAEEVPESIDDAIRMASKHRVNTRRLGDKYIDAMDMVMTRGQRDALYGRGQARALDARVILWPNGVIPYYIESNTFDAPRLEKIKLGMSNWEKMTCIQFTEATDSDKHKIRIFDSHDGCWSILGMAYDEGSQDLSLQVDGCFWRGTVEHELGHAIGLVHEHQRPNRNGSIEVLKDHIETGKHNQLEIYADTVHKYGLPYDYTSVMHYGQFAFSVAPNSLPTILARNDDADYTQTKALGKSLWASFTDIQLVNTMYQCNAHCNNPPKCAPGCFVDKYCKCFCKQDMPEVPCVDTAENCATIANSACYLNRGYNEIFCRKRCGLCAVPGTNLPEKVPVLDTCNDLRGCHSLIPGECPTGNVINTQCERTCGLCRHKTEGTRLPCKDEDDPSDCQYFAERGECDNNKEYMWRMCKKTCSVCERR